jgi:hypothetical protein
LLSNPVYYADLTEFLTSAVNTFKVCLQFKGHMGENFMLSYYYVITLIASLLIYQSTI